MLSGAKQDSQYEAQLREAFPHNSHVCGSRGNLIYVEGPYDEVKHRLAWETSAKWMPHIKNGKLVFEERSSRQPFKVVEERLLQALPRSFSQVDHLQSSRRKFRSRVAQARHVRTEEEDELAVIVKKALKKRVEKTVGIGGAECLVRCFGQASGVRHHFCGREEHGIRCHSLDGKGKFKSGKSSVALKPYRG